MLAIVVYVKSRFDQLNMIKATFCKREPARLEVGV
ncbi:hypothetical protein AAULR_19681 [Lacticaseibacillus rhamnosus MTCC 5462]|nr:hypothetical protein AAULR_19681 [Lacticaseibacillus rhamnosus MTCC 5462]